MKKKFILLILMAIVLIPSTSYAKDLTILVNDKVVESDVKPYIKDSRTFVPVRFVTEALGGEVLYDTESYPLPAVLVSLPGDELPLSLFPGYPIALISEGTLRNDVSPEIINGRTFLPVRFIASFLNFNVQWDEENWTVKLNSKSEDVEIFHRIKDYIDLDASKRTQDWLTADPRPPFEEMLK